MVILPGVQFLKFLVFILKMKDVEDRVEVTVAVGAGAQGEEEEAAVQEM